MTIRKGSGILIYSAGQELSLYARLEMVVTAEEIL